MSGGLRSTVVMRLVRRAGALSLLVLFAACGHGHPPPDAHSHGTVTMEIFSDPECQPCRRFYLDALEPVERELGDRLTVIHHLYPSRAHKHARDASRLALAGDRLGTDGRYRVLAALFRTQPAWARDGEIIRAITPSFSSQEVSALTTTAATSECDAALDREIAEGRVADVRGTPTIFANANGHRQLVPSTVQYPILRRYLLSLVEP